MARTPNYSWQKAERDRAKQAKKAEKLREREEAATRRRVGEDDGSAEPASSGESAAEPH